MFFLGSFNSVFPYLLYLSLIWIFILIGIRGKVEDLWHGITKERFHAEEVIVQSKDHQSIYITIQRIQVHQNPTAEFTPFYFFHVPAVCRNGTITYTDISVNNIGWDRSFTLRGPPVQFS